MYRYVCLTLVFTLSSQASLSQAPSLTKKQLAVRQKAQSLSPQAPISVLEIGAPEEFGTFISSSDESFVFYDVDRKANVALKYSDVRKIKDGYGGYNSARGRHTDHTKAIVITLVVIGALGAIIGAAAATK